MKKLLQVSCLCFVVLIVACSGQSKSGSGSINPRDTVVVPEYCTGEDSVAYIENVVIQSPISAEDLLGLAEVHSVEDRLGHYPNSEKANEYEEDEDYIVTHRDFAALRLANRFMRMANLVNLNGNANDKLQWALAVNTTLGLFRVSVPSVPSDSVLDEMVRVVDRFSSQTQGEMNFECYMLPTKSAIKSWSEA